MDTLESGVPFFTHQIPERPSGNSGANSTPREVSVRKGGIFRTGKEIEGLRGGVRRYHLAGGWVGFEIGDLAPEASAATAGISTLREAWRSHRPARKRTFLRSKNPDGN